MNDHPIENRRLTLSNISAEEFDRLYKIHAGITETGITSSRKQISIDEGFASNGHFIPVTEMFAQTAELQHSFNLSGNLEDGLKEIFVRRNWAEMIVAASSCACSLTSCGAGWEAGCPIGRDTYAMKMVAGSRESTGAIIFDHDEKKIKIDLAVLEQAHQSWFKEFPMGTTGRMCGDNALCIGSCTFNDLNKSGEGVLVSYFEAYMEELGMMKELSADPKKTWFDKFYQPVPEADKTGKTIAIVGYGPAGGMLAQKLLSQGHDVVIFEAGEKFGGTVRDGVPHDKYNKGYLDVYAQKLEQMGAQVHYGSRVSFSENETGTVPVQELREMFDAVVDARGIYFNPRQMGVENEASNTVPAMDYLRAKNNWVQKFLTQKAEHPDLTWQDFEQETPNPVSRRGKTTVIIGAGYTADDLIRETIRDCCVDGDPTKFDGKIITVYYKLDGKNPVDFPNNTLKQKHGSPTAMMVEYADERNPGSVEEHVMKNAKRIITNKEGKIIGIEVEEYEVTNPEVAERFPEKAKYSTKPITHVMKFSPDEDVAILLAVGYNKNFIAVANNHRPEEGVFAAGDIAEERHEVVHAYRSAHGTAAAIKRYFDKLQSVGTNKLPNEQWTELKDIPVRDSLSPQDRDPKDILLQRMAQLQKRSSGDPKR